MARVDIVVFPNGGREIFGQVDSTANNLLTTHINAFTATLEPSDKPRKFTGYYDALDASDIEWLPYDENNPIVMVPIEPEEITATGDPELDQYQMEEAYKPMELAQVPETLRDNFINILN